MKDTDVVIAIVYGTFLLLSSPYFILAGAATVDYLGIDRHLPPLLTLIVVALVPSLIFTGLFSVPLVFIKRQEIRKAVLLLFLASFVFYSALVSLGIFISAR